MLHLQVDSEDEEKECDSNKTQPPESGLNCIINPAEYNSLDELIATYVLSFVHNARSTKLGCSRQSGSISPQKYTNAQLTSIRNCQHLVYYKKIANLKLLDQLHA